MARVFKIMMNKIRKWICKIFGHIPKKQFYRTIPKQVKGMTQDCGRCGEIYKVK